jgi:hypothetical protein
MADVNINAGEITSVRLKETTVPATPAAGYVRLYAKTDGVWFVDDAGAEFGPFLPATLAAAKGDILAATAADAFGVLTVGANDTVLTADSGEATGLKWAAAAAASGEDFAVCDGRLTLTTATPVTTADVTGVATLYFTPYKGSKVGLYDGSSAWTVYDFTELSLDISGYTASKPYDIWVYDNSGTPTLDSTVWTDATTRATALTTQDGVYVKTGATTRRYLGTIYINSSGGQTDDALLTRFVWNYYNRKLRPLIVKEATSHSYTTASYRSWNNNAAVRLQFVRGVSEDAVQINNIGAMEGATIVSVGYDVTNASMDTSLENWWDPNGLYGRFGTFLNHYPVAGFHFYQSIETGSGTATQNSVSLQATIWG